MADYQYEIGITQGVMENVEDLIGLAPVSVFFPYTERWIAATGRVYGAGSIRFIWSFDYITWEQVEKLITKIMGSEDWDFDASNYVYAKTRDNFGDYHIFRAYCTFPEELTRQFKGYEEFTLEFTQAMFIE